MWAHPPCGLRRYSFPCCLRYQGAQTCREVWPAFTPVCSPFLLSGWRSQAHTECRRHNGEGLVCTKRHCATGTDRVEQRRDRFRPMASCVSALSSIVANGHQVLPTFPPPSLIIPYGGFSSVLCGAPHKYVVNYVQAGRAKGGRHGTERPYRPSVRKLVPLRTRCGWGQPRSGQVPKANNGRSTKIRPSAVG